MRMAPVFSPRMLQGSGSGIWGSGYGARGLRFRVRGSGFRVEGVWCLGVERTSSRLPGYLLTRLALMDLTLGFFVG